MSEETDFGHWLSEFWQLSPELSALSPKMSVEGESQVTWLAEGVGVSILCRALCNASGATSDGSYVSDMDPDNVTQT